MIGDFTEDVFGKALLRLDKIEDVVVVVVAPVVEANIVVATKRKKKPSSIRLLNRVDLR